MKKKLRSISVFLIAIFFAVHGNCTNNETLLKFSHQFGSKEFFVDSLYFTSNGDSITLTTFKYYISGIRIVYSNGKIVDEENSYHLINSEDQSTLTIGLKHSSNDVISTISFNVGIDSITNVSGVFGGDLDPTKGMYWTWQSGYINFKAEGKSNRCNSLENNFQFHFGGYQYPFNALKTVVLHPEKSGDIFVIFDFKKFFETIDLSKYDHIMSPSFETVNFSAIVANSFRIPSP